MYSLRETYPFIFRASVLIFSFNIVLVVLLGLLHTTAFWIAFVFGLTSQLVLLYLWIARWSQHDEDKTVDFETEPSIDEMDVSVVVLEDDDRVI